jgi:hypothetical protein
MRVRQPHLPVLLALCLPSLAAVACATGEEPAAGTAPLMPSSSDSASTGTMTATVMMPPVAPTMPMGTPTAQIPTGAPTPSMTPSPPATMPPVVTAPTMTVGPEPTVPDTTAPQGSDPMPVDTGTGGMSGMEPMGDAGVGGGGTSTPPTGGGYPEHTGADCDVSAGELAENENLPDPFAMNDGTRITTKAEWPCRRAEIKADIEQYEIGPKPEPPMVEASVSGDTLEVVVTTEAGSITLSSSIGGSGSCVAIGMNSNSSMISGCTQVPFMHDQVVGYNGGGGEQSQSDPFYEVYPDLWGKIGNYNAWSWGISRLIDGLEQVKDELGIDPTKVAVHGCSYAGKMALFGGAFDERVALTIAQESGGGGITSWRMSQNFTDRTGTDIEKIDNTNYAWFMSSMRSLDPYSLPHDHHELIAMIAPRAVVALGNQDFDWLGDESGYRSSMAAKEVFKALGVENNIGLDFTSNHGHCQAPQSQTSTVNAFVDKFLKGQDADTAINIEPQEGNFDLDYTTSIDWETPTLQ